MRIVQQLRWLCLLALSILAWPAQASTSGVVISQVYGGGGNAGSTYQNDFVELFNAGTTAVNISGWVVQYASATGSFNTSTLKVDVPASTTMQPGRYYLIKMAAGAGGTTPLPVEDLANTAIAMSATAGKVLLTKTGINFVADPTAAPNAADLVDFVGYGATANFHEGSGNTPAPSNTTSVLRAANGCTDSNNNAGDFAAGTVKPRNSATAAAPCIAAPYTVNSSDDTDDLLCDAANCTLREAINASNATPADDTIVFNVPGGAFIALGSPLPVIANNGTLTITGPAAADAVVISGGKAVRIMEVASNSTLALNNLSFATGVASSSSQGGAITSSSGSTVVIADCSFIGNLSIFDGGAISGSGSTLVIKRSLFFANRSGANGGAINVQDSTLKLSNSTLFYNFSDRTGGLGGAIYALNSTATLIHNTIAGNRMEDGSGGGLYLDGTSSMALTNNLFSANVALTGGNCGGGGITDNGGNMENADDCGLGSSSFKNAGSINLGTLAKNGGPRETMALLEGSTAIDQATDLGCQDTEVGAVDQRGFNRPQPAGGKCDIGAYEAVFLDLALTQSANTNPVSINAYGGLTYSLTAHNYSATASASNLVLTETLAAGLTFFEFNSADAWYCTAAARVVTCTLPSLASSSDSTVDITVHTSGSAVPVKTVGHVSSVDFDTAPLNNTKTIVTQVCDPAGIDSISFGASVFAASEGSPVTITVNRSGTSCSNATVHYSTTLTGTAPAADFTPTSGDFTWLPLDTKKTFSVPISNDAIYTGNRTVNLQLSSPSSNATLTKATSVINIKDDEAAVTVGLSTSDQAVSEEGGVATVTATLSDARITDTVVPLLLNGTASKIKDYSLSATSITILAGALSNSVTLTGLHDLLDEPDETAGVTIGKVSGIAASGTTTNIITFTDDDETPTVSFDSASSSRSEFKAAAVNLVLSAPSGQAVTVNVFATGGTTDASDYTINGGGTITIPAGKTTAAAVTIINDTAHESSETATFQIDSATHATPSGIQTATLTIVDDDP